MKIKNNNTHTSAGLQEQTEGSENIYLQLIKSYTTTSHNTNVLEAMKKQAVKIKSRILRHRAARIIEQYKMNLS